MIQSKLKIKNDINQEENKMKYTYTFETTDEYIGLIQKVNNFLIQGF